LADRRSGEPAAPGAIDGDERLTLMPRVVGEVLTMFCRRQFTCRGQVSPEAVSVTGVAEGGEATAVQVTIPLAGSDEAIRFVLTQEGVRGLAALVGDGEGPVATGELTLGERELVIDVLGQTAETFVVQLAGGSGGSPLDAGEAALDIVPVKALNQPADGWLSLVCSGEGDDGLQLRMDVDLPGVQAFAGADSGTDGEGDGVRAVKFGSLGAAAEDVPQHRIDLLIDVPLELTVELGRTTRRIREVLSLGPGSVIELDKLAGEAVDILVNGRPIARGEVVVIDENFGVRITEILGPGERINRLQPA